ncbi:MAG: hypothetical protein COB90_09605 [Hyphomicrobiales bacterium]|nr:MAG: hypothetical protein COB90_09605 [Hyphomicrobiales bacterium]
MESSSQNNTSPEDNSDPTGALGLPGRIIRRLRQITTFALFFPFVIQGYSVIASLGEGEFVTIFTGTIPLVICALMMRVVWPAPLPTKK